MRPTDNLLLYSRLIETRQIFFCGTHDGGYGPTLKSLETEGHLHKVVIMEGSVHTAFEYKRFFDQSELRVMSVPGLFTQRKLISGLANGLPSPILIKAAPAVTSNQWTTVGTPPPGLNRQTAASPQDSDDTSGSLVQTSSTTGSSLKSWSSVAAATGAGAGNAPTSPAKPKAQSAGLRLDLTKVRAPSLPRTPVRADLFNFAVAAIYTTYVVVSDSNVQPLIDSPEEPRLCNFFYLYRDGCYHGVSTLGQKDMYRELTQTCLVPLGRLQAQP